MRTQTYISVLVVTVLIACVDRRPVQCIADSNCDLGEGGVCRLTRTGNRWCTYPDLSCPTGFRYSDFVGDNLSDICVEGQTLTVQLDGSGTGSIASEPPGLTCSADTCTAEFQEGAQVKLVATATSGLFLGWASGCRGREACSIVVDQTLVVQALFGSPGEALWAKQLGSSINDFGHSIAIDRNDNIIAVGSFGQTVTIDGVDLSSAGDRDIYVVKLAASTGTLIWAKRFGGAMTDNGHDVAVDALDNIYVTGRLRGTVDFGSGPLRSTGESAVFALKLDANGNFNWAKKIDAAAFSSTSRIAARGDSVVIAGSYSGSMTVDTNTYVSVDNSSDVFVIALASTGETNWVRSFGGGATDIANDVAVDRGDNILLTGSFQVSISFGGNALVTGNTSNIFLAKLHRDGAHLLSRGFGGSGIDAGIAITSDQSDDIYISGRFEGSADLGCNQLLVAPQVGVPEVFLAKYTQAGGCRWAKGSQGTGNVHTAAAVAVNDVGDVAATGSFCGSISFGGEAAVSASPCVTTDVFAVALTGDGSHRNTVQAGGTGAEDGHGIVQSIDGRVFVTGNFFGFAEFGGAAFNSVSNSTDAFIVGLAPL